ncbi:MAG: L-threonylcarbamoyladenylate synthase [Nanoarchaeota archaeon]|nr:L-threonylcarbamoyladenylate synthase [Nanoarchaeota archaeon]
METQILNVSTTQSDNKAIRLAAEILKLGGLVAFPTETVYGLGADAFNPNAVQKVFEAKGRPADNPLIVHISKLDQLEELTDNIPANGKLLTQAFWPGPLTIVVKCSPFVPKIVTCGLDTVAIRMPKHNVALRLIDVLDRPIVGPSANISGRPSPTTAQHVHQDLNGKIELILDAGRCDIGVESTVVDVTSQPPLILRFGGLTRERIEQLIGEVQTTEDEYFKKRSPGTRYRHYAPEAKVVLIERGDTLAFEQLYQKYSDEGKKVGFIVYSITVSSVLKSNFGKIIPNDIENYSRLLFQMLRDLDKLETDVILVESVEEKGLGKAIMDRLMKASHRGKYDKM